MRGNQARFPPKGGHWGPLAQLVERLTLNQDVAGSIPARPTILQTYVSDFALDRAAMPGSILRFLRRERQTWAILSP